MAQTSARTRRRRTAVAALSFITLVGIVALAVTAQASPQVRHGIHGLVDQVAPSAPGVFEESPEHGFIETGKTIELSDDHLPAIANLNPDLLEAARQAAAAAEEEQGLHVVVTSGWRSTAYQQWLLDQAVARYGSADEASKWVATPTTSRHVSGEAIDIGPFDATLWMQSNASRFGLCQIYSNELWHYELASAYGGSCPSLRENAAG